MRYRCQLFEADGALASDDLIMEGESRWREDDVHILARVAVKTITYDFANGTRVILGPLQYECEWCGEYGHATGSCPALKETDDPVDEADYDLPGVDEE